MQIEHCRDSLTTDCLLNIHTYYELLIKHSQPIILEKGAPYYQEKLRILNQSLLGGWQPQPTIYGIFRLQQWNDKYMVLIHRVSAPDHNNKQILLDLNTPSIIVGGYTTELEARRECSQQMRKWGLSFAPEPGRIRTIR